MSSSNYIVSAALAEMRSGPDEYANAKSVLVTANERGVPIDEILMERFPPGAGGIGYANQRTRREIKAQIREWLAPVQW